MTTMVQGSVEHAGRASADQSGGGEETSMAVAGVRGRRPWPVGYRAGREITRSGGTGQSISGGMTGPRFCVRRLSQLN